MKVKDWDRGPGVDDPLGMTSVDLKNLGMQGDVAEMLMDLKSTKANKGQVRVVAINRLSPCYENLVGKRFTHHDVFNRVG